jgi:asparagine synthase (glutamine-hydrolysing)
MNQLLSRIVRGGQKLLLQRVSQGVLRDRLTYLSPAKLRRLERCLARINEEEVSGDLLEFGTALGGSAIVIAAQARDRHFHGFDVFSMIPPPTSEKDDLKSKLRYQDIQAGKSQGIGGDDYYGYRDDLLSDVERSFARYGLRVDGEQIRLHKGLFQDTLPRVMLSAVAFAHIDCDWYDPVAYCLASVAPLLSVGGILLIDDYNDYGGCRTAVDEFMAAHPEFELSAGANVVLRKFR